MKLFEELAGEEAITGRAGVHARRDLRVPDRAHDRARRGARSARRRRRLPRAEMAEHREISRGTGETGLLQRAAEFARDAGFDDGVRRATRRSTCSRSSARSRTSATAPSSPSCASRRSIRPVAARSPTRAWIELDGDPSVRAELVEAYRFGDDQALVFRGEGFSAGDRVRAVVSWSVRFPTMANHTATHLLQEALREVLGEHVKQAGSAVRPDKLRFDFTHTAQLTRRGARRRRAARQRAIFENLRVHTFETPIDEARNLGAMMLFGEKYGDIVRVVEVPGHVDRALRRHARPHDRGDRRLRDPRRGLRRRRRTAHRGDHVRRGVGVPARALAGARRAAGRARGARRELQAHAGCDSGDGRSGRRGWSAERRQPRRPDGRRVRRRRAARAVRPVQAAARAGGRRARLGRRRQGAASSRTSTRPSPSASAPRT